MTEFKRNNSLFSHSKIDGHAGGRLTDRQYAAIKLRVPDSGDDWLDAMIRSSLRDEFAGNAMQGLIEQSNGSALYSPSKDGAEYAYEMADAMLNAREGK